MLNSANSLNIPYGRSEVFAAAAGYLTRTSAGIREVSASTSADFTFGKRYNQLVVEDRDGTPDDALTQYIYQKSPNTGERGWDLVVFTTRAI